jgi:hypothetical protein
MAATPVSRLARWRRRRGEQSQLPQAEVVLVASLAQTGAGYTQRLHNKSPLKTQSSFMLSLEVLGPGGSLSTVLIATLYRRDASWRVSWQAATATAAYGCDLTMTTALVHRLGSGWRRQQRSGPVSSATDSKFAYLYSAFFRIGISAFLYYSVTYSAFFILIS